MENNIEKEIKKEDIEDIKNNELDQNIKNNKNCIDISTQPNKKIKLSKKQTKIIKEAKTLKNELVEILNNCLIENENTSKLIEKIDEAPLKIWIKEACLKLAPLVYWNKIEWLLNSMFKKSNITEKDFKNFEEDKNELINSIKKIAIHSKDNWKKIENCL